MRLFEDDLTMWNDTGIKPPVEGNLLIERKPCSFCGWGNHIHFHSVELTDANVEAKLRYSDDGTLEVTDHKGASFKMKFPHCPCCGAKMDGVAHEPR